MNSWHPTIVLVLGVVIAGGAAVTAGAQTESRPAGAETGPAPFQWSWERRDAGVAGRAAADAAATGVRTEAYEKLLRDNLKLRDDLDRVGREQAEAMKENARLQLSIQQLERQRDALAGSIQDLRAEQDAARREREKLADLQAALAAARREQERLEAENRRIEVRVGELQKILNRDRGEGGQVEAAAVEALKADNARLRETLRKLEESQAADAEALRRENRLLKEELHDVVGELTAARKRAAGGSSPGPGTDSDLFRKQAAGMAELRDEVAALKRELRRGEERERESESRCRELEARKEECEGTIRELREEATRLTRERRQLAELAARGRRVDEADARAREAAREIETRDARIRTLERELRVLAERVTSLTSERAAVVYNSAVLMAQAGQYTAAEERYLEVLKMAPDDAAVHFNLAILYDEHLKQPKRAVTHYRKYLELRPDAPDAAAVRAWLSGIEAGL